MVQVAVARRDARIGIPHAHDGDGVLVLSRVAAQLVHLRVPQAFQSGVGHAQMRARPKARPPRRVLVKAVIASLPSLHSISRPSRQLIAGCSSNHRDSATSAVARRAALADEHRVLLIAAVSLYQVAIGPLAAVLGLGIIPYLHDLLAALVQAAGDTANGQWDLAVRLHFNLDDILAGVQIPPHSQHPLFQLQVQRKSGLVERNFALQCGRHLPKRPFDAADRQLVAPYSVGGPHRIKDAAARIKATVAGLLQGSAVIHARLQTLVRAPLPDISLVQAEHHAVLLKPQHGTQIAVAENKSLEIRKGHRIVAQIVAGDPVTDIHDIVFHDPSAALRRVACRRASPAAVSLPSPS